MANITTYDPKARAAEKQRQRDEDQRRIESGEISRETVREQNAFLSFSNLSISSFGGSLRRRKQATT
jgi:hypothetical protein